MECRAYLYWESETGESYQSDVPAYLFDIVDARIGTEYSLYGYEENTPGIRSNRFVLAAKQFIEEKPEIHVRLVEKISYDEAHALNLI